MNNRPPVMRFLKYLFIALPLSLVSAACQAEGHSPTVDVLGSYFPAWIFCILLGLALTLIARQVLIGLKLNTHLRPAPLVYICMLISLTLVVWLVLFKN